MSIEEQNTTPSVKTAEAFFQFYRTNRPSHWRLGQAAFHFLLQIRPDLAEAIRGGPNDPFYAKDGGERLARFERFVAFNWEKLGSDEAAEPIPITNIKSATDRWSATKALKEVFLERAERLVRLIRLKAPEIIIAQEVVLIFRRACSLFPEYAGAALAESIAEWDMAGFSICPECRQPRESPLSPLCDKCMALPPEPDGEEDDPLQQIAGRLDEMLEALTEEEERMDEALRQLTIREDKLFASLLAGRLANKLAILSNDRAVFAFSANLLEMEIEKALQERREHGVPAGGAS